MNSFLENPAQKIKAIITIYFKQIFLLHVEIFLPKESKHHGSYLLKNLYGVIMIFLLLMNELLQQHEIYIGYQ